MLAGKLNHFFTRWLKKCISQVFSFVLLNYWGNSGFMLLMLCSRHFCWNFPILLLLSVVVVTVLFFTSSLSLFFLSEHDNSLTAALSLMKFCTNMYLENRKRSVSWVNVDVTESDFQIFYHCNIRLPCCC